MVVRIKFSSFIFHIFYSEIQLIHIASSAESIDDAENGLNFMQEMLELMKDTNPFENSPTHHLPSTVIPLLTSSLNTPIRFTVATAQFGKQLHGTQGVHIHPYVILICILFYLDLCSITCCSTIFCLFRNIRFSLYLFSYWYHPSW